MLLLFTSISLLQRTMILFLLSKANEVLKFIKILFVASEKFYVKNNKFFIHQISHRKRRIDGKILIK